MEWVDEIPGEVPLLSSFTWKSIWNPKDVPGVEFSVVTAVLEAIMTRDNLQKRGRKFTDKFLL